MQAIRFPRVHAPGPCRRCFIIGPLKDGPVSEHWFLSTQVVLLPPVCEGVP